MAGYLPRSFFAIQHRKEKELSQYPVILTEQA